MNVDPSMDPIRDEPAFGRILVEIQEERGGFRVCCIFNSRKWKRHPGATRRLNRTL